jgi:gamma-glutamyltranspeptidase/glutathione hydrolase
LQMEAQTAVSAPRIHHQAQPAAVFIEKSMPPKTTAALGQMGYQIKVVPELGAVNTIRIAPGALDGGFDPRKGGAALGN